MCRLTSAIRYPRNFHLRRSFLYVPSSPKCEAWPKQSLYMLRLLAGKSLGAPSVSVWCSSFPSARLALSFEVQIIPGQNVFGSSACYACDVADLQWSERRRHYMVASRCRGRGRNSYGLAVMVKSKEMTSELAVSHHVSMFARETEGESRS